MSSLPLDVACPSGGCGTLSFSDAYYLSTPGVDPRTEIALAMPHRAAPYQSNALHPIFQMNLPEGRLLEEIHARLAKTTTINPMMLLALTGSGEPIGRLRCTLKDQPEIEAGTGESLAEILAWDGAEDLFQALFQRYVMRSGISGVQPKVIVPERNESTAQGRKATSFTRDLIVKSGQMDYPHLAINEFVCMSIAKEAGLPTPEFYLSDNRQLFIMRRFDRTQAGPLGFEDFAVLTNRTPSQKYETSYESVAKAIQMFASSEHRQRSLEQFFCSVTLSCMLGNGDAHLKNFGLLYTDTSTFDIRLSPAFDIVNTTMYLPDDTLALALGGNKSIFAARANLNGLALGCGVTDIQPLVEKLVSAARTVLFNLSDLIHEAPGLGPALSRGVQLFEEATEGTTYR